jgi:hypothetical protein
MEDMMLSLSSFPNFTNSALSAMGGNPYILI